MDTFTVKWKSPDPGFWSKVGRRQLCYALWVNMTEISVGMAFGFAVSTSPQDFPEEAVKVSLKEGIWIASALFLAVPVGCILSGILMDWYGRWIAMLLCKVPLCVGWLYTAMAQTGFHLIIGRLITGFGCGMAISPPRVYIAEFTLSNMRGVLSAFPPIATAIGITLQASLGLVFKWKVLCLINALYTLGLIFTDFFLPETPYFLLTSHDTGQEVESSLKMFRGPKYNTEEELKEMIEFKNDNDISTLSFRSAIIALFQAAACKPFCIITGYIFLGQMSGATILFSWTVDILEFWERLLVTSGLLSAATMMESMTTVNPNVGYVMMSATRFCTGILAAILLYKVSRKTLAVVSCLGIGLTCLSIACFLRFTKQAQLFPQVAYIFYAVFVTLGYYTLAFAVMVEVYPLQVRGILSGITIALFSFLRFGENMLFPVMLAAIGLPMIMLIFAIVSLLGIMYVYHYLPETQNLTLQEIEEYYNGSRPTLVSQRQVKSVQLLVHAARTASTGRQYSTSTSSNSSGSKDRIKHKDGARATSRDTLSSIRWMDLSRTDRKNDEDQ